MRGGSGAAGRRRPESPGDHPYMVGRVLARNVLDAIRAARALHPAQLRAGGPAAVVGYSEGGAAAAWAAQLQPSYAPDVALEAVVAGAAAADVEESGRELEGSFFSFFSAFGAIGYASAYPELELAAHLTPRARKALPALRDSSIYRAFLRGPHFTRAGDLTAPNVLELPEWRARLRENRLGEIAPAMPVLLHHAPPDNVVRFRHSVRLRADWRALGADVALRPTRGVLDHGSAGLAGTVAGLQWLAPRLNGRAAVTADRGLRPQ